MIKNSLYRNPLSYIPSCFTVLENKFKSTAMNVLEVLIEKIASANPNIGIEEIEAIHPIKSFFHVRPWGEVTQKFTFIEIAYIDMRKLYPEKVASDSNENKSNWMSYFFNF